MRCWWWWWWWFLVGGNFFVMMIFLLLVVVVVGFLILVVGGGCQCPAEMIRFFLVGGFGRDGRLGILARLTAVLTVARDVAQLQCLD